MKFSIALLFTGSVLIALPILSHAYQLHVCESIIATVVASNGSANLPDAPTLWYAISCFAGIGLTVLGYRLESHTIRASNLSHNQNVVV